MSRVARTSRSLVLMGGLAVLVAIAVSVTPARAATITYNFSGTVNTVGAQLSPGPNFTSTTPNMTGSMTVNTADGSPGGVNGIYTIEGFTVQIGSYMASLGSSGGVVNIRNGGPGAGGPGVDRFIVSADASGPGTGLVNFLAPRLFGIDLRGPTGIFSTDALPPVGGAPSVADFTQRNVFRLQFGPGNANARAVIGELTSLTAVPLPTAAILFGVGIIALIGLGAGGMRNLRLTQG